MAFIEIVVPPPPWYWHWPFLIVTVVAATAAVVHVLLFKRDPRSAAYWVALVALVPLIGAILYFLLGINFIRRRARIYRDVVEAGPAPRPDIAPPTVPSETMDWRDHAGLAVTLDRISRFGFVAGNRVDICRNGDEAMPAMLEAIRGARQSVTLATYIFEARGVGAEFVEELAAAVRRGVQVRVMVDDAGMKYSWPPVLWELRRRGVPVQRFMPSRWILRLMTLNLRNHRKILVVDGRVGFTGGLNIRQGNMLEHSPRSPIRDLHFRLAGPVVADLQRVFAEDWAYCSGESLHGSAWFPALDGSGEVTALGIPDGPDEDMEIMPVVFFAALSAARREVRILNPYFLPTPVLTWALKLCAVRGVAVTIVVPERNNIPPVAWAARTLFPDLLKGGCRIFESPPPFDHSKIFTVDGVWSFVGSTNWDPRSLRLNFEFNLACHDPGLASRLNAEFDHKLALSREITLAEIASDSLGVRLRNGVARLFIPML